MSNLLRMRDYALCNVPRLADKVAIRCNGIVLTYQALEANACRVACGLKAIGEAAQSRVAYLGKNAATFAEIVLGAAKADMPFVPVNCRLSEPEITFILNDAEAKVLFVGAEYVAVVDRIRAQLPALTHVFALESDYAQWRDRQDATEVENEYDASHTALQVYTSGTTGRPKGVLLSHEASAIMTRTHAEAWNSWAEQDVFLLNLPLFHIAGVGCLLIAISRGLEIILSVDFKPKEFLRIVRQHQVTVTFLVAAMIKAILEEPDDGSLRSLRDIIYGAGPITLPLLQLAVTRLPGVGLTQIYGLTETGGPFTALLPEDHLDASGARLASAGRKFTGTEIQIVDLDDKPVGFGEVGEVVCKSPGTMTGYWRRAKATEDAIRNGWFHSGDIGYLDEAGYLYLFDRKNDMIVSGGENIYPAEVEAALFTHPSVFDVAVIGIPDEQWGESPRAIVVLKPNAQPDPASLGAYARTQLAAYKVPKSIEFRTELPRNATGKVLRSALREPFWHGRTRRIS